MTIQYLIHFMSVKGIKFTHSCSLHIVLMLHNNMLYTETSIKLLTRKSKNFFNKCIKSRK